jgi:hypothetical protein
VNSAADSNVRNKPTLRSLLITNYPSSSVGKTFTYQVKVWNAVGSSLSDTASYVLAGIPSTPATGPVDDAALTSSTQIKVNHATLTSLAETGGSTILAYNLQVDKADGVYYDLYGGDITKSTLVNSMLITTNIIKGSTYKLRFRARNVYGWSGWSPVTSILAADKPKAPPLPKFVSATAN